jgi:hypothetical protein
LHAIADVQTDASRLVATSKYKINSIMPATSAMDAVMKLMDAINYKASRILDVRQQSQGNDNYTVFKRNNSSLWDIPCRMVYYNDQHAKVLTPAWEVQMMDAYKTHYWVGYVDLATGNVIEKKDLIIHCNFGGPVSITMLPLI